jgi:nitrogen regulatory protein PII 2
MKEIIAIIRMNMINKTKESLSNQGFPAFHCSKVMGRGKKMVDLSFIDEIKKPEELTYGKFTADIVESYRLLPKRMLTIVVKDEDKDKVIQTIIDANMSGNPGDGKIFVCNVPEVLRVRTGELNQAAL